MSCCCMYLYVCMCLTDKIMPHSRVPVSLFFRLPYLTQSWSINNSTYSNHTSTCHPRDDDRYDVLTLPHFPRDPLPVATKKNANKTASISMGENKQVLVRNSAHHGGSFIPARKRNGTDELWYKYTIITYHLQPNNTTGAYYYYSCHPTMCSMIFNMDHS